MKLTEKFFVAGKGTMILAEMEANESLPKLGSTIKFQNQKYEIRSIEYSMSLFGVNSKIALIVREKNNAKRTTKI